MFQVYNYTDNDVIIPAGERIGQGVFIRYALTDDDIAEGLRAGGFGSTDLSKNFSTVFNMDSLDRDEVNYMLNREDITH